VVSNLSVDPDVCPLCGSATSEFRDAIDRLTREVQRLRDAADRRRTEELEVEVRHLRETMARLRGSLAPVRARPQ
jgi:hypothetical protein